MKKRKTESLKKAQHGKIKNAAGSVCGIDGSSTVIASYRQRP
jgi:hypothetical protein